MRRCNNAAVVGRLLVHGRRPPRRASAAPHDGSARGPRPANREFRATDESASLKPAGLLRSATGVGGDQSRETKRTEADANG